jgi:hypothetical protein
VLLAADRYGFGEKTQALHLRQNTGFISVSGINLVTQLSGTGLCTGFFPFWNCPVNDVFFCFFNFIAFRSAF